MVGMGCCCTALIGPDLRSNAHSTSRVCVCVCFSTVSVDGDLGFMAPNQINKRSSSARFRLDGLDWSFRLMCSSLLSVKSGLRSFIGVYLSVYKGKILTPLKALFVDRK